MTITNALIQLRLIIKVNKRDELSAIEISTIKKEILNSEVEQPVVNLIIAPRKELIQAYTIKQTKGYNSVIFKGTRRYCIISQEITADEIIAMAHFI